MVRLNRAVQRSTPATPYIQQPVGADCLRPAQVVVELTELRALERFILAAIPEGTGIGHGRAEKQPKEIIAGIIVANRIRGRGVVHSSLLDVDFGSLTSHASCSFSNI